MRATASILGLLAALAAGYATAADPPTPSAGDRAAAAAADQQRPPCLPGTDRRTRVQRNQAEIGCDGLRHRSYDRGALDRSGQSNVGDALNQLDPGIGLRRP